MMVADLHLHTTCSDGKLTPAALVALVASHGGTVIAITDHDSMEGVEEALEAARSYRGLRVIPGVELGTDTPRGEIHILGYFLNHRDPELRETLRQLREGRLDRAQRMVQRLEALGMVIAWDRVQEIAGDGAVGRPHVAQALLEKGYVASLQEAFEKYIGRNGPAYAERGKMSAVEAVALLRRRGGVAVLAHPAHGDAVETFLGPLKEAGLAGMEVYYGTYPPELVRSLGRMAQEHGLIPCGGSDFHALGNDYEGEPGRVGPPLEAVARLEALVTQRAPAP